MLDMLFLKYLSEKGKKIYFLGQIVLFAILLFYLFGIEHYSYYHARPTLYTGTVVIVLFWGFICLKFWKKKD